MFNKVRFQVSHVHFLFVTPILLVRNSALYDFGTLHYVTIIVTISESLTEFR
jgi:hypothetical protein